jgi:hypothetical protein
MLLRPGWRGKAGAAALALGLAITVPAVANAGSPTTVTTYGTTGVRLNQIQVVGTHESYHLEATPAEKAIREAQSPDTEHEFEYTASPVSEQLSTQNVRQLEFDVWADPNGGLYANPLLRQLAGEGPYDPVMLQPGTKVLQAQDVDYNTRCLTLVACLRLVKTWSDSHQSAVPIAIMLEFHDELLTAPGQTDPVPGTVVPLAWTRERMLALEQEILSVFPRNRILTPDNVRKSGKTLEQSVKTDGWPTVDSVRGKVMFLMDQKEHSTRFRDVYVQGNPSLEGRVMWSQSTPGQPDAAFLKRYVWEGTGAADITNLVSQGYMVRTRADADTLQARANDTTDRDLALNSGAQWVSTDYPAPGMAARFDSPYYVAIPGGTVARCNPVAVSSTCRSAYLEPRRR